MNEIDIKVNKFNEFYIQLELKYNSKIEISRNLSSYFSQFAPNYLYDFRFKKHLWDGKIRYFNTKNNLLPIGLLSELKNFCKLFDYTYVIDEKLIINNLKKYSNAEIKEKIIEFVKHLNIPDKFSIRNYQYSYFAKFVEKNVELLESPTASGKSLIIYLCIRYALTNIQENSKILLIVPTIQLVEQMYKDFIDYGFNSEKYCAKIYSGTKDSIEKLQTNKKIILSTWQSLYKLNSEEFENIEMIVGDEIHEFSANKAKSVILNCKNVKYKLGTTATLKNDDLCSLWTIKGLFDEPIKYVDTIKLIEDGYIANFEINVMNLIYPENFCEIAKNFSYIEEIDYVNSFEEKVNFIVNLSKNIIDKNENLLILFKTIEYGKKLKEEIINQLKIEPFYVDGSIKMTDREEVRINMEQLNSQIAVCSFGTFARGINIKNLQNLIFANSTKTEIRILQSIGRTLRLHERKEKAKIYDIVDNLKYKRKINYCLKHFYERKEIYDKNKFHVKFFDINIK